MYSDGEYYSDDEPMSSSDEGVEDDCMCLDEGFDMTTKKKADTSEQKVFLGTTLMPKIDEIVTRVNDFLGTSTINCRVLLFQFKWNEDVLIERFCEVSDIAKLMKAHASKVKPTTGEPLPMVRGQCDVCFDDSLDVVSFSCCGTKACKACMESYLSGQIHDNGAPFITCPGFKCTQLIDDSDVLKYCSDKEGYQKVIINSYVLVNNRRKWCPAADCGNVIEVSWTPSEHVTRTVYCNCGKSFCFNCYGERHEPVSCHILQMWQKKSHDDSETMNWIAANTKTCPKCRNMIEKNGGCNHMTCRQPGCGHEFCWICYAAWNGHNYECRKYVADVGGERSKAEADLQRFLFYDNLYNTHRKSIESNNELYAKVHAMREKIALMEHSATFQQLEFLVNAVDTLLNCRTTLMYTYAFAFYLQNSLEKTMFEDNQIDLEQAVEALNGYLEKEDLEKENLQQLKQNIVDKSAYVEKRRLALLEHVRQGEENDFWKFDV